MESTPRRRLIGLYSPSPQSGKTTVAQFLTLQQNFYHASFATPIKQVVDYVLRCADIEQETINLLKTDGKEAPIPKLGYKSYRELCQSLGTYWGRDCVSADIWRNLALANMPKNRNVVFDDVRFENEYLAIKQKGGEVWRIERPYQGYSPLHATEGRLDYFRFDRVIKNTGSLDELFNQVITKEHKIHVYV